MIKSIIFDWGGVLAVDNNQVAAELLAKKYSVDKNGLYKRMYKLEDSYSSSNDSDGFYQSIGKEFGIPQASLKDALNSVTHNEVFDLAKTLSESYKAYILSNQMKPRTDSIRKDNNLSFFTKLYFSNEIGLTKPSPQIFDYIINDAGIAPIQSVFIDDNEDNTVQAKKHGFNTILFKDLENLQQKLLELSVT